MTQEHKLGEEKLTQEKTLFAVLEEAMSSSDYFAGQELDDNQDFSNWGGSDFRQIPGAWVLAEKFFEIPTLNNYLVMRITQTDPQQYWVNVNGDKIGISFVLDVVNSRHFKPVIFVGHDGVKGGSVLRRKLDAIALHTLPDPLQEVVSGLEIKQGSSVVQDSEGDAFAEFIRIVLERKTAVPTHARPPDEAVREELKLGPEEEITEENSLLAGMSMTEQDMLGYAFADMVLSVTSPE